MGGPPSVPPPPSSPLAARMYADSLPSIPAPPASLPLDPGESYTVTRDVVIPQDVNLVPGTYKITIGAGAGMNSPDYFGGKFSQEKTQIKREIKAGEDIVIDVAKPQG